MTLQDFLQRIENNATGIQFADTMQVIADNYIYQPTEFSNGLSDDKVINAAGSNEGSCKIFAFAQLNRLTPEQTLQLFGDYYRKDVLENPQGSDHQNIRNFIRDGWDGITFTGTALTEK